MSVVKAIISTCGLVVLQKQEQLCQRDYSAVIMSDRWLDRRRFVTGLSTVGLGGIAGCTSGGSNGDSTPTATPARPFSQSDNSNFPKYSGSVSISGDDDYWSFKIRMESSFSLRYTVTNTKSESYDFDVFVLSPEQYDNYLQEIRDSAPAIEEIEHLSSQGVVSEAQKSGELDAGTYFFVVDNTDIGDAGDIGGENTREVTIELETYDPAEATETPASEDTEEEDESTADEVIYSFERSLKPGTYEQPSGQDWVEDAQYNGRASLPILLPDTAQIQYDIDLSAQEGYDTIPLNCYFVDATTYLYLQQNPRSDDFETISSGTKEDIGGTESFSFVQSPGVYFLIFESATMGRESEFTIDFEAVARPNDTRSCIETELAVPLNVLEYTDELVNVESWNAYYHVQYNGEADTTYQLEVTYITSDDEKTITQQRTQTGDCGVNFVHYDEISMNVVEMGEPILSEVKVFDESGETLLAEREGEINYIQPQ